MGVKKLKSSTAPASRYSKKSIKKKSHLHLVPSSESDLDSTLELRQREQMQNKQMLEHYQEVISKTLEDPEMVKKAAMLLMEMIEK